MKLGYTIVYVEDVAATLAFYESAFGFTWGFVAPTGDYGELSTGETTLAFATIALGQSHFSEPMQPVSLSRPAVGIELAFVTDNVHAAFDRACAAGAKPLAPPEAKPWGQTVAYVRSQEGTLIELCSPVGAA